MYLKQIGLMGTTHLVGKYDEERGGVPRGGIIWEERVKDNEVLLVKC